jgi:hypothetical protein
MAHVDVTGRLRLTAAPADAFRFFTPEGERLYVPGWDPEYLHPADGTLTEGLTFRTRHGGETTVWLVSHCDIGGGAVDYVRVTPESRIGVVSVRVRTAAVVSPGDSAAAASDVTVRYRLTSLSVAGERTLEAFAAEFPATIAAWERQIDDVLRRGR